MDEMITLPKVIAGLAMAAVGIIVVIKSEWFLSNFGEIDFAEKHFMTAGGTRFFYKLIGMAIAFIGFMLATGLLGAFMGWVLSPLINTMRVGE